SIPHLHAAVRHIASSRAGSKARVELELQVSGILLQGIPHEVVFSATPGEEYPDSKDGPALYLYYAQKGEAIFDIARRYHARASDLATANHLTIPEGQSAQELTADATCLLIPAAL
ncbi:MAG: LysM domain-containing protein, partial [Eubacteriales bacterium]|nr:LysM domain-containing protein [Eubacteriales bacterium]